MVFSVFFTRLHTPADSPAVSHRQPPWPVFSPATDFSINPSRILHLRTHANNRRWDSNAETFRTRKFDFDSTNDADDFEDEDDDDDDSNQWLDILEDFIDGPKAFLMALAIPMGQSALSLLFQTVWGRPRNKTRRRGKTKSKPPPRQPPRAASYMDVDDEQEEYVENERKKTTGYQTWVASDDKTNGSSSSFGGWEELDGRKTRNNNKNRNRKKSTGGMSRRVKRNETPLLLRLLIAVFPFLGSWTKLL